MRCSQKTIEDASVLIARRCLGSDRIASTLPFTCFESFSIGPKLLPKVVRTVSGMVGKVSQNSEKWTKLV